MRALLLILLLASALVALCNSTEGAISASGDVKLLDIGDGEGYSPHVNDEKERIDTIIRAFKRLPDGELDRLGVQLDEVVDGQEYAPEFVDKLINAWNRRQIELKEAMKSIAQPVEFMERIMQGTHSFTHSLAADNSFIRFIVMTNYTSEEDLVSSLHELESLLGDIDIARDFHTIGGWKLLVTFLDEKYSVRVRSLTAWAIGTTIKNNYDYQLWVLEAIPYYQTMNNSIVTCLDLLIRAFGTFDNRSNSDNNFELYRRVLYALSAAVRGNIDVQDFLLNNPVFMTTMKEILLHHSTRMNNELERKIWTLVTDILEEVAYIKQQLITSNEVNADVAKELLSMRLLGEEVCRDYKTWFDMCKRYIQSYVTKEVTEDSVTRIVFSHVLTTTGQLQSVLTHSLIYSHT